MLEKILDYEKGLFFILNGSDSTLLDHFMWLISSKIVWYPWIALLLFFLFYKKTWKEGILILITLAVVITLCDQIASGICKPLFQRYRPTHHPEFMEKVKIVFNYVGGRYGFASSHASNAFGVAFFTSRLFKYKLFTITVFTFAILNSYSRIYLGVHFISDIVVGALIGMIVAGLCYPLYRKMRPKIIHLETDNNQSFTLPTSQLKLLSMAFWLTLILILAIHNQLLSLSL